MDPVMFSFFGVQVHWYGALFVSAILLGSQVMKWIYVREGYSVESLDTLLIYSVVGIVVGARLGHCLFYEPQFYLNNPLKILAIWEGGLASHGGGLGVIFTLFFYHKKHGMKYIWLLDRLAIPTALFGFFVRFANFVNSEIIGIPSNVPWAIVFTRIDELPRHPVQLYEALTYLFIFLFLLLAYKFTKIKEAKGSLFGLFLCSVFSARFLLEFVKVKQAGYSSDLMISTGQALSIPFVVAGMLLLVLAMLRHRRVVL
jgi:prolipoprotein diacylglyceryl transferase